MANNLLRSLRVQINNTFITLSDKTFARNAVHVKYRKLTIKTLKNMSILCVYVCIRKKKAIKTVDIEKFLKNTNTIYVCNTLLIR